MTKVELYGGPFDGRQLDVPAEELVLRVPVPNPFAPPQSQSSVLVARYMRVHSPFATNKIKFVYVGEERL